MSSKCVIVNVLENTMAALWLHFFYNVMSNPVLYYRLVNKTHKDQANKYSCVQNNSSVFKKGSKAQNPYNNFYFNTHKCIGNIPHSILNKNMNKNLANLLLLYRK